VTGNISFEGSWGSLQLGVPDTTAPPPEIVVG
jgi:hypothetical protein